MNMRGKVKVSQKNPKHISVRLDDIDYARCLKIPRGAVRGKAILSGGILTEWQKDWLYGSKKDY